MGVFLAILFALFHFLSHFSRIVSFFDDCVTSRIFSCGQKGGISQLESFLLFYHKNSLRKYLEFIITTWKRSMFCL